MSAATATARRSYEQARADAEAFRDLFPPACYRRWEVAGSVRRKAPSCGDVEHVVIPAFGEVDVGVGLFTTKQRMNLLWFHLDSLVRGDEPPLTKHIYGATGYRWGEKHRGVDFRGFRHEFFCADEANWGATLAIRTGPAEFSQRLVAGLLRNSRRNHLGRVWQCEPCPETLRMMDEGQCDKSCPRCQGTGLLPVTAIAVAEEREYIRLCGMGWVEPEARG